VFLKISVHKNPMTKILSVKNYNDANWESLMSSSYSTEDGYIPKTCCCSLFSKKINTTAETDSSTNQKDAKLGWRLLCFEELHISTQKTQHWHTY
jgi:hypothetical protein